VTRERVSLDALVIKTLDQVRGLSATFLNRQRKGCLSSDRTWSRTFPSHLWTLLWSSTVQSRICAGTTETRLQVRAEGNQSAIAILHYKLTRVPWHVGKSAREFDASSCILSVKRVRIFDEYVRVEQFVRILVGIGGGSFGTADLKPSLAS
jgi:hypothetical protein